MSFYIFKASNPIDRKADLVVFNRDANHENKENLSIERLLMLSSRRTYLTTSLNGRSKKVEDQKISKFDRDVLLTQIEEQDELNTLEGFLKLYKKIFRFAIFKKYDSIEAPFLYDDINIPEMYVSEMKRLVDKLQSKHDISVGFYGKNITNKNNLQTFIKYGAKN